MSTDWKKKHLAPTTLILWRIVTDWNHFNRTKEEGKMNKLRLRISDVCHLGFVYGDKKHCTGLTRFLRKSWCKNLKTWGNIFEPWWWLARTPSFMRRFQGFTYLNSYTGAKISFQKRPLWEEKKKQCKQGAFNRHKAVDYIHFGQHVSIWLETDRNMLKNVCTALCLLIVILPQGTLLTR